MKTIALLLLVAFCASVSAQSQCGHFEVVNPDDLGVGYTEVGPNLILNQHNELVLTDPTIVQGTNFSIIQGVSATYYGDPICIAVIDCGAAGSGSVQVSIYNIQSARVFTGIELKEICSNDGVFFGCVDTAFIPDDVQEAIPPGFVVGVFGDELRIQYVTSPVAGHSTTLSYSVWLACKEHEYWDYELISTLMVEDAISRNIRKLTTLREKVSALQSTLFDNDNGRCEDIGMKVDLSPAAMESFEFLDCIIDRNVEATHFLTEISA